MKTVVNENSSVYYKGSYWNDLPVVKKYMYKNFTGDENVAWMEDFRERFCKTPFKHGLAINCGNGWVERQFIDSNIVSKVTAFDYSTDLLKLAEEEKGDRNIEYFQADVNKLELEENKFDLVINVAALHHVQYINRLSRVLCGALKEDGYVVNFDYIGPHRNQFPLRQRYHIKRGNRMLPAPMQKKPLIMPHLPTMLHGDPTEAIHSELIIDSLSRYFDITERHDTGGGIAYYLLTHNDNLNKFPLEESEPFILKLLEEDWRLCTKGAVPHMFSYFIARPRKESLSDTRKIARYQRQENRREEKAARRYGTYYIGDTLTVISHRIYNNYLRARINKAAIMLRLKK